VSRPHLELADVFHQHLRLVHLRSAILHVRSGNALDVFRIEHCLHGLDGMQWLFQFFQKRRLQHLGVDRRFIRSVFKDVPTAENQIVQSREGDEILDHGGEVVGALSEADGGKLCERANRSGHASFDSFDTGDESGAHGTDTWN